MEDSTAHADGYNPLCGDKVSIYFEDGPVTAWPMRVHRYGLRDLNLFGVAVDRALKGKTRAEWTRSLNLCTSW